MHRDCPATLFRWPGPAVNLEASPAARAVGRRTTIKINISSGQQNHRSLIADAMHERNFRDAIAELDD